MDPANRGGASVGCPSPRLPSPLFHPSLVASVVVVVWSTVVVRQQSPPEGRRRVAAGGRGPTGPGGASASRHVRGPTDRQRRQQAAAAVPPPPPRRSAWVPSVYKHSSAAAGLSICGRRVSGLSQSAIDVARRRSARLVDGLSVQLSVRTNSQSIEEERHSLVDLVFASLFSQFVATTDLSLAFVVRHHRRTCVT